MSSLPWHHVHITITDREAAARWHEQYTLAKRVQPTKRSENLFCGPNLMQIQSESFTPEPRDARIDNIGIGVSNIIETVADWQSAGGSVETLTDQVALVRDPWGVRFELVEKSSVGYTHINIAAKIPQKLCDWYESNIGGTRTTCEWDDTRFALEYDTIQIVFMMSPITSVSERPIDHLGWYTEDLEADFNRLSSKGVHFPVAPRPFGPVRLAFAEDPSGNWIELLEPPNGVIIKPT